MPLHRTAKGDSPSETLALLVKRIERGGGTVVQIMDEGDEWVVQATAPTPHHLMGVETRA